MKKSIIVSILVGALMFLPITSSFSAQIQKGTECKSVGKKVNISSIVYKCEQWGSANYWVYFSSKKLPAFEIKYLKNVMARVLRDLSESECRALDGIMVDGSLDLLSGNYSTLADNAVLPPGVKASKWVPRLWTLSDFANQAAEDWYYGDFVNGSAKISVIHQETQPILDLINRSLGTKFNFYVTTGC